MKTPTTITINPNLNLYHILQIISSSEYIILLHTSSSEQTTYQEHQCHYLLIRVKCLRKQETHLAKKSFKIMNHSKEGRTFWFILSALTLCWQFSATQAFIWPELPRYSSPPPPERVIQLLVLLPEEGDYYFSQPKSGPGILLGLFKNKQQTLFVKPMVCILSLYSQEYKKLMIKTFGLRTFTLT